MSPCFGDTAKNRVSCIDLTVGYLALFYRALALTYMYLIAKLDSLCNLMTDFTCSLTSTLLNHLYSALAQVHWHDI